MEKNEIEINFETIDIIGKNDSSDEGIAEVEVNTEKGSLI